MKKTLTSLLFASTLTVVANGATLATETSTWLNNTTVTNDAGSYKGVRLSLDSTWLTTKISGQDTPVDLSQVTSFTLNSFTIKRRPGDFSTASAKLAIKQGSNYLFLSPAIEATTSTSSQDITFTFESGIQLNLNEVYDFCFVTSTTSLEDHTIKGGALLYFPVVAVPNAGVTNGASNTTTGFIDGTSIQSSGYKPIIKLSGTMNTIPEPTTATLGLLGLASLLLRRRRS